MSVTPLRVGISRCLLGEQVRHDGGHKLDPFLIEQAGSQVEWVPVCPEMEVGLGTPREPMQLTGDLLAPRLVTVHTGVDHTGAMARFSAQRAQELQALRLCGFIVKSASPSCGINVVAVFDRGRVTHGGIGLFARAFMKQFPLMPVEEEIRLHEAQALQFFLARASEYRSRAG